jgi:hypothetical protein
MQAAGGRSQRNSRAAVKTNPERPVFPVRCSASAAASKEADYWRRCPALSRGFLLYPVCRSQPAPVVCTLRMRLWIIDQQAFCRRRRIERRVGGYQRQWGHPQRLALGVDHQRRGALHGIVAAQRVGFRQAHGTGNARGGDVDRAVLLGKVLPELRQRRSRRLGSEGTTPGLPGERRHDFDTRNAGDVEGVAGRRVCDAEHPAVPVSCAYRFTTALLSKK